MIALLPAVDGKHSQFNRLSVRVVLDDEMSMLHERYSKISGTTDVLTFVQHDPHAGVEVDLAICADEAARRSADLGHSLENELALYAVHGLLHAAGFNDHNESDARSMHLQEDRILTELGIGAVYVPPGEKP